LEFKEQVLKEVREVGNASQVARRHGLVPKVVYNWMEKSRHPDWQTASPVAKKVARYVPSSVEFKEFKTENDTLKKILGDKQSQGFGQAPKPFQKSACLMVFLDF